MGIVVPFAARRHGAVGSRAAKAARASSVTVLAPPSNSTMAHQYSGGIVRRARQLLTVDLASPRADASGVVPPNESMMSSTVMDPNLVRVTRTCQEYASRETTPPAVCGSIGGMLHDPPEIIAPRLRLLRLAIGFKRQSHFAAAIGVEKNTYNPWETGKRALTWEAACIIRNKFAIPTDYLFWGANEDRMPSDTLEKLRALQRRRRVA